MIKPMAGYVDRGEIPGIVTATVRGGEVRVDAVGRIAFGDDAAPVRPDTVFRIASMTKPICAVAALTLVEDGVLALDEPVDRLLPELAGRRVLRRADGPLTDTVPAKRPITVRDVLTFRTGFGFSATVPFTAPALVEAGRLQVGVAPPRTTEPLTPDEWLARFATLPLIHQPGAAWTYQTSATILGILIARAAGTSLDAYLLERVFEPLGMPDTGFAVPKRDRNRFTTMYAVDPGTRALVPADTPADSAWATVPPCPDAGGDLVSTVEDFLRFARALAAGGGGVVSPETVAAMTTDQLEPGQSTFDPEVGWGFGLSVTRSGPHAGRYGWSGGLGTCWFTDPRADLIAILLTQRAWESPQPPPVADDFITAAYDV
jgi:CubicO group peptidase (beta-lactamase class C family)